MMNIKSFLRRFTAVPLAALTIALIGAAGAAGNMTPGAAEAASDNGQQLAAAAEQQSVDVSTCKGSAAKLNLDTGVKKESFLTATSKGYMRVYYDGKDVKVEYLDENMNAYSYKTIALELPVWGGFYEGKDAYYLAVGQNNKDCVDGTEVVRIIKYDKSWKRLGAGSIYAEEENEEGWIGWEYEIRYPFHYGSCTFSEINGKLYFATGREGYVDDSIGMGHQGMMLITMDESSFETKIIHGDFSHSFAQYLASDDEKLYMLELSEGARGTVLNGDVKVFPYGGHRTSVWAAACFASVDGLAVGKDNILGIGTSIDQSQYDNVKATTSHNIYLTVTPQAHETEEATTVKWLTNYENDGKTFTGLHLTKINDNRFLVIWGEYQKETNAENMDGDDLLSVEEIHYLFIDQNGKKLTKEFVQKATISECEPIIKKGKAVFYASSNSMIDYYLIDTQTGAFSKRMCHSLGTTAAWKLDGNTLIISGKGMLRMDRNSYRVHALSTIYGNEHYYENSWKLIASKVKKIVIEEGITGIGDNFFYPFTQLTSVELPDSLTTIGEDVFLTWYCGNQIKNLTIPKNVRTIGHLGLQTLFSLESLNVDPENQYFTAENDVLFDRKKTKIITAAPTVEKLQVPASVKELPLEDFMGVSSLTDIVVDDKNTVYASLKGVLYNRKKTELLLYPQGKYQTVALADSVQKIGERAFLGCYIRNIVLPDSVKEIGGEAFCLCKRLTTVKLGNNLQTIGESAFSDCEELTKISFPASLKVLGDSAFLSCSKLQTVNFSEGLGTIGEKCFCYSGVKALHLPSTVSRIGADAFKGCTKNHEITVASGNKYFTAIDGVLYNKKVTELLKCPLAKEGNLTIPGTVKKVRESSISSCDQLTSITVQNGVKTIEPYAFRRCLNLESVYIPGSVTTLEKGILEGCTKVTVYGEKNTAAESYAKEQNIPFSTKGVPMKNLTEMPRYALFGSKIQVDCLAAGGSGEYLYAVYYRRKGSSSWMAVQKLQVSRHISFTPKSCSIYEVCVRIKDSKGVDRQKTFTLTTYKPLKNTSALSEEKIYTGSSITVNCSSTGGVGKKTYAVWYKNPNNGKWYRARNYAEGQTVTLKPKQTGSYTVRINTKDERGKVVKKDYTLTVYKKLVNTSFPLQSTVSLGSYITVYGSATGGTNNRLTYRYAAYYKKASSTKWILCQDYSLNEFMRFRPSERGTYNICVYVKDGNGKIAKKKLNVTVQ